MKILRVILLLGVLCLVFQVGDVQAQCAMCRATVENNISSGASEIGRGLNTGILYLMIMPYILLSAIAYLWYRNSKFYTAQRVKLAQVLGQTPAS